MNRDGKPDLATVNENANTVSVLLGNGNGTFKPKVDYAVSNLPKALQIADLNLDGKPDLAVANWNDTSLSVLAGKGDGTFQPKADYAAGAAYSPDDVQVADVNLDGKPDLVYTSWSAGAASVLLGN